jgi:hypothetical protein
VAAVNGQSFADEFAAKVKERAKSELFDMIPPDQFRDMVKAEFDRFVKEDMRNVVIRIMTDEIKTEVKAAVSKVPFVTTDPGKSISWTDDRGYSQTKHVPGIGDYVKEYLDQNREQLVDVALRSFIGPVIQSAISSHRM